MGKKTDLESVHLVNHSKCMMAAFQNFRQDESMLDVTLVCDGLSLKAHKLILSACSPLFKDILSENPSSHPIIILRNFEFSDLKAVIDFIYKGELSVPRERLMSALKVAEELHIRGLRRSEPNTEKYEQLYNQIREKLSSRKKRKRRRRNSTDSEERECLNVTDSDENFMSDDSLNNSETLMTKSQPMDVENRNVECSREDTDSRPVVLHVGDPTLENEELISKNEIDENDSVIPSSIEYELCETDVYKEDANFHKEKDIQDFDSLSENIASSSQLDSFERSHEHTSLEDNAFTNEEIRPQAVDISEEQSETISSSCLPSESTEVHSDNETKYQGKSFVCSQCNIVFTSRINFVRHKMLGHNNSKEITLYKCEYCSLSTEDYDSLESHLLTHKVPLKCSSCNEEFESEDLYNEHLFVHKTLKSDKSPLTEELFPENMPEEKSVMFRCSVCLTKFPSKLSCQIHERMCQGGS